MPRANAHNPIPRRRLLTLGAAVCIMLTASPLRAQQEKKKRSDSPIPERPPVNTPVLVVDAVTAPVAGNPPGVIIMTLNIDCGTVENARTIDNLMPRVYNAVIIELNREPLGRNGLVSDRDLEALKQRLTFQINRALQGPQITGVYIRTLQEVPRRS